MIRITLPFHLRTLARIETGEVALDVNTNGAPLTQRALLDALEARYPVLRGTIRTHETQQRRPFLRYFAAGKDLSLQSPDESLPHEVAQGSEPFMIVGSIAGG